MEWCQNEGEIQVDKFPGFLVTSLASGKSFIEEREKFAKKNNPFFQKGPTYSFWLETKFQNGC